MKPFLQTPWKFETKVISFIRELLEYGSESNESVEKAWFQFGCFPKWYAVRQVWPTYSNVTFVWCQQFFLFDQSMPRTEYGGTGRQCKVLMMTTRVDTSHHLRQLSHLPLYPIVPFEVCVSVPTDVRPHIQLGSTHGPRFWFWHIIYIYIRERSIVKEKHIYVCFAAWVIPGMDSRKTSLSTPIESLNCLELFFSPINKAKKCIYI